MKLTAFAETLRPSSDLRIGGVLSCDRLARRARSFLCIASFRKQVFHHRRKTKF